MKIKVGILIGIIAILAVGGLIVGNFRAGHEASQMPERDENSSIQKDNASMHETIRTASASYELYLPENYSKGSSYKLLICLSPGGNGKEFYDSVYPAADRFGWIMACSNDFKNDIPASDFLPKINETIQNVRKRFTISEMYIGGLSGGGMGSYVISYFNPVFSGLIINSGAIHPFLYDINEIKKIKAKRIVLICGKKDNKVPCEYMKNDEAFLKSAGFETLFIEFDGEHGIAPKESYMSAIEWLNSK